MKVETNNNSNQSIFAGVLSNIFGTAPALQPNEIVWYQHYEEGTICWVERGDMMVIVNLG